MSPSLKIVAPMERKTELLSLGGRELTRPAMVMASEELTLSAGEVLGRAVLATVPGKVTSEAATPGSVRASAFTADTGFSTELSPLDIATPSCILPDAPPSGPAMPLPLQQASAVLWGKTLNWPEYLRLYPCLRL